MGVAVRLGTKNTAILYLIVQLILMLNIIVLSFALKPGGLILLSSLIPYLIFLPKIFRIVIASHDQPAELPKAAGMNVQLHLSFSALYSISMIIHFLNIKL